MKKIIFLLAVILLTAACNNTEKYEQNDYYIIINNVIPIGHEFEFEMGGIIAEFFELIDGNSTIDIDKIINKIDNVQKSFVNRLNDENIQSKLGKKILALKIENINNASKHIKQIFVEFEKNGQMTYEAFGEISKQLQMKSVKKALKLEHEQELLLKELQSKVKNKK